jgi:hypothetical protein
VPDCQHCDTADSLEIVSVQAAVVFTYTCTCCGKDTVMHADTQVEDKADLHGVEMDKD